jgi:hypothetical protein
VARFWATPQGVRVGPDGVWSVGGLPVAHAAALRHMKSRLRFENGDAFIVDGGKRLPVAVDGPPFEVLRLVLDPATGDARVRLDDGTEETLVGRELRMSPITGRFECPARGGQTRAVLSRAAHQSLLDHVDQEGGAFFLVVGPRRIPVWT